jgi:hypothetical protein
MPRRPLKRWKVLPPGTFEGKTVTLAETDWVETHRQLAAEFMSQIFELDPGDYLITDETDLVDFTPFAESATTEIWARIENEYGIGESDVGSGLLVRIFEAISKRRRTQ